ncbi:hypothetical protein AN644_04955 [Candidatus Epulonipiscium fishelsonii]|nr:hypothetical protein AN644_04955 [Epulopiscium sp. SCG-C06WGA-EpuloA1]
MSKKNLTKQQRLMAIFLKSATCTFLVGVALIVSVAWAYETFIYTGKNISTSSNSNLEKDILIQDDIEIDTEAEVEAVNKTIAVFGTDVEGFRTDVILVVNFNSITNKIKVISIPRDTRVEWSSDQQDLMTERRGFTQNISKLNEMTAYAGIENIRELPIAYIEAVLGVKVDNYVVVSLSAFRKVVDAIGGVEVYVPKDMNYSDPYQDLYINLEQGFQTLNGEEAEEFVRFRHDKDGDLGRIERQQLFLDAFVDKILSPSITTKIPQLIPVLSSSFKTDASISEIVDCYPYLKDFDVSNLEFYLIPGQAQYVGDVSYFIVDMDQMTDFVDKIFYEHLSESGESSGAVISAWMDEAPIINKNVTIEILNASGVSGHASREQDKLNLIGYNVVSIGNYDGGYINEDLILAKNKKYAEQFLNFYEDARIIVNQHMYYDIQIVLGQH